MATANEIVEAMPVLMSQREWIQARRQRSDVEIECILGLDLSTFVKSRFLEYE